MRNHDKPDYEDSKKHARGCLKGRRDLVKRKYSFKFLGTKNITLFAPRKQLESPYITQTNSSARA